MKGFSDETERPDYATEVSLKAAAQLKLLTAAYLARVPDFLLAIPTQPAWKNWPLSPKREDL